jgi:DNA-binding NtrC family response regulator
MGSHHPTCDDSVRGPDLPSPPEPGLLVVVAAGRPETTALVVGPGGIEIGRANPPGLLTDDDRVSRRHARISLANGRFRVDDLDSRNGTFVDGRPAPPGASFPAPVLIRIGKSLLWGVDDIRPFAGGQVAAEAGGDAPIVGGALRRAYAEIALAGRAGDTLCLRGESGSGKELAALAFHEARKTAADAPFVAVNCAAIPEGLAERLLFGARKGAYSGATVDAEGYVQAADGGTLFLDEIAELGPLIQAKLLRVLESREVLPLGASRAKKVTLSICAASHKNLPDEVLAGRFREDLYFRIGRPEVRLPALRERFDEIPFFVARELRKVDPQLSASVAFVEACCLRAWPGNVRELLRELRRAGHRAREEGSRVVDPVHLSIDAGVALASAVRTSSERPGTGPSAAPDPKTAPPTRSDEDIRRALADHAGNVRGTARALGIHRNQLRRWLAKHPDIEAEPEKDD